MITISGVVTVGRGVWGRLKDWQRNAVGEERLNGSALLNKHREIDITAEEVINKFVEKRRQFYL